MKQIPLTKGKFAIVDDEDYPYLSRLKWKHLKFKDGNIGVATQIGRHTIYMNNLLLPSIRGFFVLHQNENQLDNRKENLVYLSTNYKRHVTRINRLDYKTSKYKGVYWYSKGQCWRGQISKGHKRFYLGEFENENDAAIVYNKKAKEIYGNVAYQNKID